MADRVTNQGHLTEGRAYRAVEAAVRGFGAFRKRWAVLEGLAGFVVLGPGCLLLWFLGDWLIGLPPWPLLGTFAIAILVGLWAAGWKLARPALRRVRVDDEALLIESLHGKLDNQVIASLQLGREVSDAQGPLGYSAGLVAALVEQTAALLSRVSLRALLDLRRARRWLGAAATVAVAALACLVFAGDAVAARAARLRDAYAAILDALFPVTMIAHPGDVAVVRGRPVTLSVEVRGARRRQVRLVRGQTAEGRRQTTDELALDEGKASFQVARAEESFTYEFEYGGRRTPRHTVLVGDLPTLSAIHYELSYPAYTGQPPRTLVGQVAKLQGLVGTEVLVSFAATTELHPDHCRVVWQGAPEQEVSVSGRFGHFAFVITRRERAELRLTGAYGPRPPGPRRESSRDAWGSSACARGEGSYLMGRDWGTKLKKRGDIVTREIAGETILVPIRGKLVDLQRVFTTNPAGALIWQQLDGRATLGEIRDRVVVTFDVEAGRAASDVQAFVGDLVGAGLLEEAS